MKKIVICLLAVSLLLSLTMGACAQEVFTGAAQGFGGVAIGDAFKPQERAALVHAPAVGSHGAKRTGTEPQPEGPVEKFGGFGVPVEAEFAADTVRSGDDAHEDMGGSHGYS